MEFDAVTIAVIAGVVAVLLLAFASTRRGRVDRPRDEGRRGTSADAVASAAILGSATGAAPLDDDDLSEGDDGDSDGGSGSDGGGSGGGDGGGGAGGGDGDGGGAGGGD
jgi:hypothetical protein